MQTAKIEYCRIPNSIEITEFHLAFYYQLFAHMQIQWESADTWKLIMVYEGELEILSEQGCIHLKKDQLVLLPPNVKYDYSNPFDNPNKFTFISFKLTHAPSTYCQPLSLSSTETLELITLVRSIQRNYVKVDYNIIGIHEDNLSKALITKKRMEIYLLSILSPKRVPIESFSSDYNRILDYLSKNVYRNLTLKTISRELNMSPSNIKRLFSKYAKISIMQYFNQLRTQTAISLLQTGTSVKEVSEMLDYSSQSAFCTSFKNLIGVAPSTYYRAVPTVLE